MKNQQMTKTEVLASLKRIYLEVENIRKFGRCDLTDTFCLFSKIKDRYETIYSEIARKDPESLILPEDVSDLALSENECFCIPSHVHEDLELRNKADIYDLLHIEPKRWPSANDSLKWYERLEKENKRGVNL